MSAASVGSARADMADKAPARVAHGREVDSPAGFS
jgi:hypothetical protein